VGRCSSLRAAPPWRPGLQVRVSVHHSILVHLLLPLPSLGSHLNRSRLRLLRCRLAHCTHVQLAPHHFQLFVRNIRQIMQRWRHRVPLIALPRLASLSLLCHQLRPRPALGGLQNRWHAGLPVVPWAARRLHHLPSRRLECGESRSTLYTPTQRPCVEQVPAHRCLCCRR
jgi:hypothetical protein